MKALVYNGPGRHSWHDVEEPAVEDPTDAVVQIDAVTICGTDLHILKGDVPTCAPGRVLGHEAVGTIVQVGEEVRSRRPGDRVLISCISSCGHCRHCRTGKYGLCTGGGGWILGHTVDGTQAELVRVPFADASTYPLPEGVSDEDALMLADIMPTSWEVGVLNGQVRTGDVVVVVGAGPIGLACLRTSRLLTPRTLIAVDPAASRRDAAKLAGADIVVCDAVEARTAVLEATGGAGADVVLEAVGLPDTFELCMTLVRSGGHVANIGVHGSPATLHLEDLWARDVTITTGLVDTSSTEMLLTMLASHRLDTAGLVTHRFGLPEMMEAYDVFGRASENGSLKVALFRT
ncbi:MAG: zinc-containing dehydrogenase [Frankiales bacterium]|nr:zinc-containing dehydrogenase [Frankiales bacterium]